MSLTKVVPYFRTAMDSLGHKEWKDALADDNIPSQLLDRSYHLKLGNSSNIKQNMDLIEVNQPIEVRLFVKGYRDTAAGRDKAVEYKEAAIKKCLEASRRTTSFDGIKNVLFQNGDVDMLSQDNDNVFKVTMNFNCIVTMANA